jgi:hypothetical protein
MVVAPGFIPPAVQVIDADRLHAYCSGLVNLQRARRSMFGERQHTRSSCTLHAAAM